MHINHQILIKAFIKLCMVEQPIAREHFDRLPEGIKSLILNILSDNRILLEIEARLAAPELDAEARGALEAQRLAVLGRHEQRMSPNMPLPLFTLASQMVYRSIPKEQWLHPEQLRGTVDVLGQCRRASAFPIGEELSGFRESLEELLCLLCDVDMTAVVGVEAVNSRMRILFLTFIFGDPEDVEAMLRLVAPLELNKLFDEPDFDWSSTFHAIMLFRRTSILELLLSRGLGVRGSNAREISKLLLQCVVERCYVEGFQLFLEADACRALQNEELLRMVKALQEFDRPLLLTPLLAYLEQDRSCRLAPDMVQKYLDDSLLNGKVDLAMIWVKQGGNLHAFYQFQMGDDAQRAQGYVDNFVDEDDEPVSFHCRSYYWAFCRNIELVKAVETCGVQFATDDVLGLHLLRHVVRFGDVSNGPCLQYLLDKGAYPLVAKHGYTLLHDLFCSPRLSDRHEFEQWQKTFNKLDVLLKAGANNETTLLQKFSLLAIMLSSHRRCDALCFERFLQSCRLDFSQHPMFFLWLLDRIARVKEDSNDYMFAPRDPIREVYYQDDQLRDLDPLFYVLYRNGGRECLQNPAVFLRCARFAVAAPANEPHAPHLLRALVLMNPEYFTIPEAMQLVRLALKVFSRYSKEMLQILLEKNLLGDRLNSEEGMDLLRDYLIQGCDGHGSYLSQFSRRLELFEYMKKEKTDPAIYEALRQLDVRQNKRLSAAGYRICGEAAGPLHDDAIDERPFPPVDLMALQMLVATKLQARLATQRGAEVFQDYLEAMLTHNSFRSSCPLSVKNVIILLLRPVAGAPAGVNIRLCRREGMPLLHRLLARDANGLVAMLWELGVDPNERDMHQNTSLHCLVLQKAGFLVDSCPKRTGDAPFASPGIDALNDDGETPRSYLMTHHYWRLLRSEFVPCNERTRQDADHHRDQLCQFLGIAEPESGETEAEHQVPADRVTVEDLLKNVPEVPAHFQDFRERLAASVVLEHQQIRFLASAPDEWRARAKRAMLSIQCILQHPFCERRAQEPAVNYLCEALERLYEHDNNLYLKQFAGSRASADPSDSPVAGPATLFGAANVAPDSAAAADEDGIEHVSGAAAAADDAKEFTI